MVAGTLTYDTKMDTKGLQQGVQKAGNSIKSIVAGLGITKIISTAISTITNSIDGAISRLDTLNNFPKVMRNMGISAEESQEAITDLSNRIKGIPTTLDDAALAVERFTSKNGDVKKSVDIFDAVNNAILAGGASAQIQQSALEQLSQAYSKGKPDMMEWRTLQMAMPAQLNQVAKAMGKTTDALGEGLRNGKISMDDFIETFIELNKEGIEGFESFEVQARNSTGGIKTSISNAKTAVTRGVADIISSINEALQSSGAGSIGQIISNIGKSFENVLKYIGELVKKYLPPIVEYISKIINNIKDYIQKNNIQKTIEQLGKIAVQVAKSILNALKPIFDFLRKNIVPLLEKLFKWIKQKIDTANVDKLRESLKKLAPIVTSVVAGFVAFKTVTSVVTIINNIKTAFAVLIKTITTAMLTTPMLAFIAALTAVIAVLTIYAIKSQEAFKAAEKSAKESFGGIGKAFDEYGQKLENAKSHLDGFNTRLFQTEEEQQKLEDDLRDIQNSITDITSKASEERRSLTQSEIDLLDSYFEKLRELRQKQIDIQQAISEAVTSQAETDLKNFDGTFEEYSDKSAEWIKTSKEQYDTVTKLANDHATEEIAILNTMYTEEQRLADSSYQEKYNSIVENRDKTINAEKERHKKVYELAQEGYDKEITLNKNSISELVDYTKKRKDLLEELSNTQIKNSVWGIDVSKYTMRQEKEIKNEIMATDKKITESLDSETQKQIGIWAKNLEETKKAGGEISQENIELADQIVKSYKRMNDSSQKEVSETMTALQNIISDSKKPSKQKAQEMVDALLEPFSNLKSAGQQAGSDLLQGAINGIDSQSGTVYSRVAAVGSRMLQTLKSSLKEQSPSKATYQMGEFFVEGLENGIKDNQKDILRTVDKLGDEVVNKMSNAVTLETGKINAKAMLESNINRTIQINASFDGNVEMDNRKVGRIIAPDVSRAIKVGGL